MPASGEGKKGILIIAEAPGETEDRQGIQLVGEAGQVLEDELRRHGVSLHEDCRKINAVNCRPPKNRTPTPDEIAACRPMVSSEIQEFKPKLILLLGNTALASFYMGRPLTKATVTRMRGYVIPDREARCWVSSTYHPSFILRNSFDKALRVLWHRDLALAVKTVSKAPDFRGDHRRYVKTLTDETQTLEFLRWLKQKHPHIVAFDYETTGLKPHREGHRIVSCSVCWHPERSVSFLMTEAVGRAWKEILEDGEIKKIIQNGKFELLWSRVKLGSPVRGFVWDTEVNAHLLDNRQFFTGLKFQTYLHFGVDDYSVEIAHLLKSKEDKQHGANGFNALVNPTVVQEHAEKILLYGGLDSLYTFWGYQEQKRAFEEAAERRG